MVTVVATLRVATDAPGRARARPVTTRCVVPDRAPRIARASAAMFQSYIFDINGIGMGGNGRSCVIDPSGRTLHQSSVEEELIPIEIDFDQVRRQRDRGMMHLGQPLKSFRDRQVDFHVYDRQRWDQEYLNSLGPLKKPERGDHAD